MANVATIDSQLVLEGISDKNALTDFRFTALSGCDNRKNEKNAPCHAVGAHRGILKIRYAHKQRTLTAPLVIAKKMTRNAIAKVAVIAKGRVMGRKLAIDLQKYHPAVFWIRTVDAQRQAPSHERISIVAAGVDTRKPDPVAAGERTSGLVAVGYVDNDGVQITKGRLK